MRSFPYDYDPAKDETTERSKIRHESYCRKRARNPASSRKKSCVACAKNKSYCSRETPACSHCRQKNVVCRYRIPPGSETTSNVTEVADADADADDSTSASSTLRSIAPYPGSPVRHFFGPDAHGDDVPLEDISTILDSSCFDVEKAFPTLIHSQGSSPTMALSSLATGDQQQQVRSNPPWLLDHSGPGNPSWSLSASNRLVRQPTPPPPKAFQPRGLGSRQSALMRKYLVSRLCAYPLMFLPGQVPPPFIHAMTRRPEHVVGGKIVRNWLPGPLAASAVVARMWHTKDSCNSAFLWGVVQREQDRLFREVRLIVMSLRLGVL